MPKWIYNRPSERCQESELKFATLLNHILTEDWLIRWGYWYEDGSNVLREGDFLVLGPYGGIAVFEVKSDIHYKPNTGEWRTKGEGGQDLLDNPLFQLTAQHAAVIRQLNDHAKGQKIPYVAKALVFPNNEIDRNLKEYRGIPRDYILGLNDLKQFTDTWHRLFPHKSTTQKSHRDTFLAAFGDSIQPRNIKKFVSETDSMILQQATASYQLLDMLAKNRQLIIEGGVGTGKTWMALESAKRLAINKDGESGRDVLMIAYNLALYEYLRIHVAKRKLTRGSITVKNTEALAAEILEAAELCHEVPQENQAKLNYYNDVLPSLAYDCLHSIKNDPVKVNHLKWYDALVVDEAQDHDSRLSEEEQKGNQVGWWSIYVKMLKEGWNAPMALFGDVAQRPPFRGLDRFDWSHLRPRMSQNAFIELNQVVRYTRQIYCFLKGLDKDGADRLVAGLRHTGELPDGPEVELLDVTVDKVAEKVEELLDRWDGEGLCSPDKVLLLYNRSQIEKTALANLEELSGHPLRPYLETLATKDECIKHSSVHKAKGLDELAVVMVGMNRYEQLNSAQDRYTYFMGASRARQILAVVHVNE